MKKTYVYDFETIQNCFLAVYINIKDTSDMRIFEISDYHNHIKEFIQFNEELIDNQNYIVSFNGLNFDAQVAQFILEHSGMFKNESGSSIAKQIFAFVNRLFKQKDEKGWVIFKHESLRWNEIDLAAINNYNNKQKFASLKWLQYNMDWHNIIDMDCKPEDVLGQDEIIKLTRYCINDCLSTRELLTRNVDQIKVRADLSEHFGIPLQNLSEPKLVKAILSNLLSKDMGIEEKELRYKKTFRKQIHLKEAILPYIEFQTPELKKTLAKFKSLVLDGTNLKGSFKHKVTYRGLEFSFALGGIHGAKRGVYKAEEGMIIKSFDVKSYYPNLCIRNGWSPAHLPADIFCKRYEWFYDERLKYPKLNPLNYLYKIVLNSAFGLSNDDNSFLKDSMLTMKITCNGQLLLVMLMEQLCESIPGARPVMINTDGGEIILPKEYEPLYDEICKKWEEMTNLVLEFEQYEKLIIFDVNNYIGIFSGYEIEYDKAKEMFDSQFPKPLIKQKDDKVLHYPVKLKGRFEIDKALHKNKSYRIKPIAIYNYFVHGVDPEKTILKHNNIYDFCAGIRMRGNWKVVQTCVTDGEMYNTDSQKTIRYFRSSKGCKLVKRLKEEDNIKEIKVEADNTLEQVAIKIDNNTPFKDYELKYEFYTKLVRDEIHNVEPPSIQTSLF